MVHTHNPSQTLPSYSTHKSFHVFKNTRLIFTAPCHPHIVIPLLQHAITFRSQRIIIHSFSHISCPLASFAASHSVSPSGERSALTRRRTGLSERQRGRTRRRTNDGTRVRTQTAKFTHKWRAISGRIHAELLPHESSQTMGKWLNVPLLNEQTTEHRSQSVGKVAAWMHY